MWLGLLKTMRPKQWTKNVFVYAALVFDEKLLSVEPFLRTTVAFALFCLVSSSVYIINDLADIEKDRQHPQKRNRPLASGRLKPAQAVAGAVAILALCLPAGFWLDPRLGGILAGYLVLNLAYSLWLKHIVIIDVMSIAAGFVLRVVAGVIVVNAERFSPWLYICMTFLALFMAIGKRRHELVLLEADANSHRRSLDDYSLAFLDEMIHLVTAGAIIGYSLYTFFSENLPPNHTMMLTIPFVIYGLFRYLYLVHVRGEGGRPEDLLLQDRPFFLTVALWGLAVVLVMYVLPR
jgi:4-hydroxybenzoate polyprenyltransferase